MKRKVLFAIASTALACLLCFTLSAAGAWSWVRLRSQPGPATRMLFEGITYTREVRRQPRPMVIHVVIVDLRSPGITLLVTPGNPESERPLEGRTTGQFLDEFGVQVAINGDGCFPWYSNHLLDYYPRAGDPISPVGFAASRGTVYSQDTDAEPTVYLSRTNAARFGAPGGRVYNALSGNLMLVEKGERSADLKTAPDKGNTQPRTALALDKRNRQLILVVVDGRQAIYSAGATLDELAGILLDYGGYTGMNLDGGGSTTLVVEGEGGRPQVLNSPIDQGIPGRQRPVCNHLGIYAGPGGGAVE